MGVVGDRVINVCTEGGEGYSIILGTNAIQKLTRVNSENSLALSIDFSLRKKATYLPRGIGREFYLSVLTASKSWVLFAGCSQTFLNPMYCTTMSTSDE